MKPVVLFGAIFTFVFAIPLFSLSLKQERGVYACWRCGNHVLECKCKNINSFHSGFFSTCEA